MTEYALAHPYLTFVLGLAGIYTIFILGMTALMCYVGSSDKK